MSVVDVVTSFILTILFALDVSSFFKIISLSKFEGNYAIKEGGDTESQLAGPQTFV